MIETLPFIQATKLYLKALRSMELTQYKRTKEDEKKKIIKRNKKLYKLGFILPEIKLPLK